MDYLLFVSLLCSATAAIEEHSVEKRFLCGGDEDYYTTDNGTITSHSGYNVGRNYGKNLYCVWTIEAPAGLRVELVAEDFSLSPDPACFYDYLQLLDGNSTMSPSIGKFCGDMFGPITSTGNALTLLFVTDEYTQDSGFKLFYNFTTEEIHNCLSMEWRCGNGKCIHKHYRCNDEDDCGDDTDEQHCNDGVCNEDESSCPEGKCISRDWLCDGDSDCKEDADEMIPACPVDFANSPECGPREQVGTSGNISSPGYPDDYPSNVRCVFLIQAPPGTQNITFTFSDDFEMEGDDTCALKPCAHCAADYLRIASDDLTYLTSTYCGEISPGEVVVIGNMAYIDFVSDRSEEHQGFSLQWQATS